MNKKEKGSIKDSKPKIKKEKKKVSIQKKKVKIQELKNPSQIMMEKKIKVIEKNMKMMEKQLTKIKKEIHSPKKQKIIMKGGTNIGTAAKDTVVSLFKTGEAIVEEIKAITNLSKDFNKANNYELPSNSYSPNQEAQNTPPPTIKDVKFPTPKV
jgi:hypothetical protein